MIKARSFKGQDVAVFGLGRSGITAALSLKAGGAIVHAWDDREAARKEAGKMGVDLSDLTAADWSTFSNIVLSPGVPHKLPEVHWTAERANEAGVPIICDIEIFAREVESQPSHDRPKIIAITGTNGKSTTTALIGHILKSCGKDAQIGGNIGRGVLDLDRMHSGTHYVLELSSYQLERTNSLRANAAVFLNLTPDHLERHGDMQGYETAKRRIFNNQIQEDALIIGVDNDHGRRLCTQMKAANGRRIVPISGHKALGRGASVIKGKLYCSVGGKCVEVADLTKARSLEGYHNWQNAAAAYAAVASLGIDSKAIGKAILTFKGLEHRMQEVGKIGPIRFINDSKATNAEASKQALSAYDNIYWIAGGIPKEGGIEPLKEQFSHISRAYLIGDAAKAFHKTLKKQKVSSKISGEMELAILCATRDALASKNPNPVILLSPACASFDQFKDFETRGDAFREDVKKLIRQFKREKSKGSPLVNAA